MNNKIWHWIGDYCSGLLDKSEERELRAWMDEAEENKQLFMEGVKMVREYQMVACSSKGAPDSLKRVQKKATMYSSCCSSFCCDLVRFIICILLYSGIRRDVSRIGEGACRRNESDSNRG